MQIPAEDLICLLKKEISNKILASNVVFLSVAYFIRHNTALKDLFTSTVYEFIDIDGVLLHVSAYGNHH
jgi:hypothetical protein